MSPHPPVLRAAATAVAALLVASPGFAAFTLTLTQGSSSETFTLATGNTAGTTTQEIVWNGFEIDVTASTNTPGGPTKSFITDTALAVRNKTGAGGGLQITLKSDGFAFPSAGTAVTVRTDLSTKAYFDPAGVTGSSSLLYTSGSYTTPNTVTLTQAGQSVYREDATTIQSTPFSIANTMAFNGFGKGQTAYTSITTTVTTTEPVIPTPAPAGLILIAGALPFTAILRRMCRSSASASLP
jgi:hypothetical protein